MEIIKSQEQEDLFGDAWDLLLIINHFTYNIYVLEHYNLSHTCYLSH